MHTLDDNFLLGFCKYRTLNHKFPTECGRWQNINLFIYLYSKSRFLCVFRRIVKARKVDVAQCNTVVSNHFHSVKILFFSSARSRDFDGLIGIELPVSMHTTKTPIDMCRFNVRSSTLKNLNIFCKRKISIKLFYLYHRLQCRDKYFFKIKFVFFLYLRLSASSKENDLSLCMYF